MRRALFLGVVGGLIVIASLVAAIASPRYPDCAPGWQRTDTARYPMESEASCTEVHPELTSGTYLLEDRLGRKIGIAIGGVLLGAALGVLAVRARSSTREAAAASVE